MRGRTGFTLIELLIVVAIIALLISVLLPALGAARAAGKRAVSGSNMRQIGVALHMYCDDHRGRFPETTHGQPAWHSWINTLKPFLAEVDEVRLCPADPQRQARLENGGASYILNEYIAVVKVDPFGAVLEDFTNREKLRQSSRTVTTFVGADDLSPTVTSDHTHSRQWFDPAPSVPWNKIRLDIQVDRYRSGGSGLSNLNGSTLFLYADSHVSTWHAGSLKQLADTYDNFAFPPQ